jgi:Tfp pilus assembly protein PilV
VTLIEVLAAGLLVLASALVFKQLLAADRQADEARSAQPVIRRRRRSPTGGLRKAA